MFVDANNIERDTVLQTAVCIIGGGMAGITIALELGKQGIDSILLESGGFTPDKLTRDLYRGENVGLPYIFADGCRSRYLGGSSNCWGGWCAPLDELDFEKRDWVNYSGWPFGKDELAPYYVRSHSILQLGPVNFDPQFWEKAIDRQDVRRMNLGNKIRDTISQFSAPARFGSLYRSDLRQSQRSKVILYANVTNIETDEHARNVSRVEIATFEGNRFYVSAKQFVLATGGIENARLLLASNKVQQAGLGNGNDLVGRFFMDHPRLLSANMHFTKKWSRNRLYDIKYHYHSDAVSANGTRIASQFALTPETQRMENLLNARVSFSSVFPGEGSEGALALWRLKQTFRKKNLKEAQTGRDLISVMTSPLDVAGYGFTRFYKPRILVRNVKFQFICEQQPNPDSRVMLSHEKDQLGMNRVRVDWRLGELEQRTINRTVEIITGELRNNEITEQIIPDPHINGNSWPAGLETTWHHMGTTKMNDSAKLGVVDRNCRVHSLTNLYIAGSSVFPTGGANFPTITLIALAIRLSEHIKREM